MNSPYSPPKSDVSGAPIDAGALRWRAAVIFSFIPTSFMAILQASSFDSPGQIWSMKMWEPTLYMLPPIVIAAASGYVSGAECARSSLLGILPLGAKFGLIWACAAVACGDVVELLQNRPLPHWTFQIGVFVVMSLILIPLATVLCAWVRRVGKKLGVVAGP